MVATVGMARLSHAPPSSDVKSLPSKRSIGVTRRRLAGSIESIAIVDWGQAFHFSSVWQVAANQWVVASAGDRDRLRQLARVMGSSAWEREEQRSDPTRYDRLMCRSNRFSSIQIVAATRTAKRTTATERGARCARTDGRHRKESSHPTAAVATPIFVKIIASLFYVLPTGSLVTVHFWGISRVQWLGPIVALVVFFIILAWPRRQVVAV